MRWAFVLLWLGVALGQTLNLPPEGQVGKPLEIRGTGFPPGKYTLELTSPSGTQKLEVEAVNGGFSQVFTPQAAGDYALKLVVGTQTLASVSRVLAQAAPTPSPAKPELVPPRLVADGLQIGNWKLPLVGQWSQPKTLGQHSYIASGPLVLEIDLQRPAVVNQYYPPAEVRTIETDPEVTLLLEDNRRLTLDALAGRPYEGKWESLKVIRDYLQNLAAKQASSLDQSPLSGRPYWYYLAQPVNTITPADLQAVGNDLLQRGHRPELPWGSGVMTWIQPWLDQVRRTRTQGIESSLVWSDFFLKYMPQVPGAKVALWEQIGWFEAQGRIDLGQRYREGMRQIATWQNPLSSGLLASMAWVLLGLYGLLLLYFVLIYLPAQLRGLQGAGGWLLGWIRHPMLRLRHSSLAYTTFGERLLLLLLFILAGLALLAWGFDRRAENLVSQDSLARGTLRSYGAQETLRSLANSAPMRGLLAYSLAKENPTEAQRLYSEAPPWAYVLLGRGTPETIGQAYRRAPGLAPAREAVGLSGDLWTAVYKDAGVPREGVPTPRVITASLGLSGLQALRSDFLATWRSLPIWPGSGWGWAVAVAALLLTLYQVVVFFVPRPQTASGDLAWRRGVQLLVPGSPWFSQGWGVLVLLVFGWGIWLWTKGNTGGIWLAVAALLIHLFLWFMAGQRRLEARR